MMKLKSVIYLIVTIRAFCLFLLFFWLIACNERNNIHNSDTIPEIDSTSPALTARESMKTMRLEKGFTIELVAEEPMVNSPVAMVFDEKGRIWVLEMQSYMPDTIGTGEELPTGKIVILEDTDENGIADKRTVFMDSLVLPRAIHLIENGILVAEPPALWFYPISNDKPAGKILVDSLYATGGNVEHQPNGLYRGVDNRIYNAEGRKRYKKEGNRWLIENMYPRGQWGISQDDYGRLFYNNNSANILGDYFGPWIGPYNANQSTPSGFSERIVPDNRVFPLRPTTGVNRGYMENILDSANKLIHFTAASGPVIYRGDLFGENYYGNAFAGEPSANLIKRNILVNDGYRVTGRIAYEGKEFLASTDERFRPVTLYNGPDGALYVVDMYRGIIQHKTYLTGYLKNEIAERNLDKPINCGRIYRILPTGKKTNPVKFPSESKGIAELLKHPNGWVRDKAMHLLADRNDSTQASHIRNIFHQHKMNPGIVTSCLWTLHHLDAISPDDINVVLNDKNWKIRMTVLNMLPDIINKENYRQIEPAIKRLISENDTLSFPLLAYMSKRLSQFDRAASDDILQKILKKSPDNRYVADAVISNMEGKEYSFQKQLLSLLPDTGLVIHKQLNKTLKRIEDKKQSANMALVKKQFPEGAELYKTICQTCHGADGNGIAALAPPLNNSEWVNGNKNRLISILLYGMSGPVTVGGKKYTTPEISSDMPGFSNNKEISNEDLSQVMSFIRKAWSNKATAVSAKEVTAIRNKYRNREKTFTENELMNIR